MNIDVDIAEEGDSLPSLGGNNNGCFCPDDHDAKSSRPSSVLSQIKTSVSSDVKLEGNEHTVSEG